MLYAKTMSAAAALSLVVLIALGGSARSGSETSQEDAAAFLQQLRGDVVGILAAYRKGDVEKAGMEFPALMRKAFDLELIGRAAVGRYWHRATPQQRAEYQALFAEYVLSTFSPRLAAFGAGPIDIVGSQPVGKSDVLVLMRIDRPEDTALRLDWRVRADGDGHKIIDVQMEGVSMLLTKRQEFAAVIMKQGMDGLLEGLRTQAAAAKQPRSPNSASLAALAEGALVSVRETPLR